MATANTHCTLKKCFCLLFVARPSMSTTTCLRGFTEIFDQVYLLHHGTSTFWDIYTPENPREPVTGIYMHIQAQSQVSSVTK